MKTQNTLKVLKVCLVLFNFLHLCASVLLWAFGIAILMDVENFRSEVVNTAIVDVLDRDSIKICCIYMIVIGVVSMLVSFYGLFAIYWTSKRMLAAYSISGIFLLFSAVVLIAYSGTNSKAYTKFSNDNLLKNILIDFESDVYVNSTSGEILEPERTADAVWMRLQMKYSCCGVAGYEDYRLAKLSPTWNWIRLSVSNYDFPYAIVPISCCKTTEGSRGKIVKLLSEFEDWTKCISGEVAYINTVGCSGRTVSKMIKGYSTTAIALCSTLIAIFIVIAILSACTCRQKTKLRQEENVAKLRSRSK